MELKNRQEWEDTQPKDKGASNCAFCDNYNQEPEYIIQEYTHWYIVHNKYPVLGLDTHLMAIPRKHRILSTDLTDEEVLDFKNVSKFMFDFYKGKPYFQFMRESLASRSMEHIHYHFIIGNIHYDDLEIMLKKQGF